MQGVVSEMKEEMGEVLRGVRESFRVQVAVGKFYHRRGVQCAKVEHLNLLNNARCLVFSMGNPRSREHTRDNCLIVVSLRLQWMVGKTNIVTRLLLGKHLNLGPHLRCHLRLETNQHDLGHRWFYPGRPRFYHCSTKDYPVGVVDGVLEEGWIST